MDRRHGGGWPWCCRFGFLGLPISACFGSDVQDLNLELHTDLGTLSLTVATADHLSWLDCDGSTRAFLPVGRQHLADSHVGHFIEVPWPCVFLLQVHRPVLKGWGRTARLEARARLPLHAVPEIAQYCAINPGPDLTLGLGRESHLPGCPVFRVHHNPCGNDQVQDQQDGGECRKGAQCTHGLFNPLVSFRKGVEASLRLTSPLTE